MMCYASLESSYFSLYGAICSFFRLLFLLAVLIVFFDS